MFVFRALAKINCVWEEIPSKNLLAAIVRCGNKLNSQEISNVIYGFSKLGCSWNDLPSQVHQTLSDSISRNIKQMNSHAFCVIMYSIPFITFDCNYDISFHPTQFKTDNDISYESLYQIHTTLLTEYLVHTFPRNNDQLSVYFTHLLLTKGGKELVKSLKIEIPFIRGPSADIPSESHEYIIHTTENYLKKSSINCNDFSFFHEFNGLPTHIFPVDTAVWYKDKLLALIEIDGEYHYQGTKLRRKDQLKEFLYNSVYKDVIFIRKRIDQFEYEDLYLVGIELANTLIDLSKNRDENMTQEDSNTCS